MVQQAPAQPANTETFAIWVLKNGGVAIDSSIIAFVEKNNRTSLNKLNYDDVLLYIKKFGLANAIADLIRQQPRTV